MKTALVLGLVLIDKVEFASSKVTVTGPGNSFTLEGGLFGEAFRP